MHLQAGSYTNYFADALIAEAEVDSRVVGIHAAMGGGTGMNRFEQRFPERTFDVGIAEQVGAGCHAHLLPAALFPVQRSHMQLHRHALCSGSTVCGVCAFWLLLEICKGCEILHRSAICIPSRGVLSTRVARCCLVSHLLW